MPRQPASPVVNCPFTIICDTREQAPYSFAGIRADAKQGRKPIVVQTVTRGLESGDYSIVGHEPRASVDGAIALGVAIERKSPQDAWATFTCDRERFERELIRLDQIACPEVLIECDIGDFVQGPIDRCEASGKTIEDAKKLGKAAWRSVLAWKNRFRRVHWTFAPGRAYAEIIAYRILDRYWQDYCYGQKERQGSLFGADAVRGTGAINSATTEAAIGPDSEIRDGLAAIWDGNEAPF